MLGREILSDWRHSVGDKHGLRWPNDELLTYLSEAQEEAALRRHAIRDAKTPEVCGARFEAGQALVPLHPKVLMVRSGTLVGAGHRVFPASVDMMDRRDPDWSLHEGRVDFMVTDHTDRSLRLYRIPVDGDTLWLMVTRLPLVDVTMDAEPEIAAPAHRNLRYWLTYRAFMKQDGKDPPRALEGYAMFEQHFGPRRGGL